MFGKLFAGFLAVFAALACVGYCKKKHTGGSPARKDPLEERSVENVADLNDPFVRARGTSRDEE